MNKYIIYAIDRETNEKYEIDNCDSYRDACALVQGYKLALRTVVKIVIEENMQWC